MNNKIHTEPELLTPADVAAILQCTERQLKERIMKRPGFPRPLNQQIMGRIKRWRKQEIHAWIEKNGR